MTRPQSESERTALEQEAQRRLLPLEICDGHDVGNKPLSCINCARQLGRKEGMDEVSSAKDAEITALREQVGQLTEELQEANGAHDETARGFNIYQQEAEVRLAALEAREQGLRDGLGWALKFVEERLRAQHTHSDDVFDTCPSHDCKQYRALKALAALNLCANREENKARPEEAMAKALIGSRQVTMAKVPRTDKPKPRDDNRPLPNIPLDEIAK